MSASFKSIYSEMTTEKLIDIIENPAIHGSVQIAAAQLELSVRNVSTEELMRLKMLKSVQRGAAISVSEIGQASSNKDSKGIIGFIKSLFT